MAFIGSLITTVKANTSPFSKNLKKAGKSTQAFRDSLKTVGTGIAKVGLGLGAVATGALVVYTVQAFKAIDATAKLASELDLATSSLTAYQLAAGLSGTDTATLNKALQRMARTVGEARSGITTGTKALEDFGIELEDLKGLSTEQIFEEFAQRIKEIPDPLERAAKAALIFGKAGQKLLNFLSMGKAGLAEVKQELEDLGIAFNEVDAAKVEAANDAILRMQTVGKGLGNTLAIELAPFIESIAKKMTDFIKASGGIDDIVKSGIGPLTEGVAFLADTIQLGRAAWNGFSAAARTSIALVFSPLTELDRSVRNFLKSLGADLPDKGFLELLRSELIDDAAEDLNEMDEAFKNFDRSVTSSKVKDFFEEIQRNSEATAEGIKGIVDEQEVLNRKMREALEISKEDKKLQEERLKDHEKVIAAAQRIFEETRTPLESVEAEILRIIELLTKGLDEGLQSGLDRKLKQLKEERQAILDAQEGDLRVQAGKSLDDVEQTGEETRKQIEAIKGPFADILEQGQRLIDGFTIGPKATTRLGGFKELDLDNIDIAGLERSGDIQKKQLTETQETNNLIGTLINVTRETGRVGAFAT